MEIVTPENMQRVNIQPGWLLDMFAEYVLGIDPKDEAYETQLWLGEINTDLAVSLVKFDTLVAQKNKQYEDAWQKDGPVTALCDLKDKLYRLDSASKGGAILMWDPDKLRGTFFDILVRTFMCMAWFGANFSDDDDDRQFESPTP